MPRPKRTKGTRVEATRVASRAEFSKAVNAIVKKHKLPTEFVDVLTMPFKIPPLGALAAKECSCTKSCACSPLFEWELTMESESESAASAAK